MTALYSCVSLFLLSKRGVKELAKKTKQDFKIALIGESISFERKGIEHEGIVFKIYENSVLVDISEASKLLLGYETNKTVVRHGNYTVLSKKEVSA